MVPVDYKMVGIFYELELFGKLVLCTILRVDEKSLPEGLYMYDLRHSDEDWSEICEIKKHVLVNHYGAIITNEEIDLDENGYKLVDTDDWSFTNKSVEAEDIKEYFKI